MSLFTYRDEQPPCDSYYSSVLWASGSPQLVTRCRRALRNAPFQAKTKGNYDSSSGCLNRGFTRPWSCQVVLPASPTLQVSKTGVSPSFLVRKEIREGPQHYHSNTLPSHKLVTDVHTHTQYSCLRTKCCQLQQLTAGNLAFALMMEAARTSETLVNLYQTTRRYNPEIVLAAVRTSNSTLHYYNLSDEGMHASASQTNLLSGDVLECLVPRFIWAVAQQMQRAEAYLIIVCTLSC
jgi:hypothetical protein